MAVPLRKLILASTSHYRRCLLERLGIPLLAWLGFQRFFLAGALVLIPLFNPVVTVGNLLSPTLHGNNLIRKGSKACRLSC
ncbi:MAG: hypothetical protein H6Q57_2364 [Geobacteraceae bacterium]|nr:hypothetical protein [Geobacteraceae bacterium]